MGESRPPLAHLGPPSIEAAGGSAKLRLAPVAGRAYLHLRTRADDSAAHAALEAGIGAALPVRPNTIGDTPHGPVAWLGPGEWLLELPGAARDPLERALRAAIGSNLAAVTDLSDAYAVFEIRGEHALDLLAKGMPLDLDPQAFPIGACARTALAKANVLIRPVPVAPGRGFLLLVDRSYADYLWRWLTDAAIEFTSATSTVWRNA